MDEARAFWVVAPGQGEIRAQRLRSLAPGELLIRARSSAISSREVVDFASPHAAVSSVKLAGAVPCTTRVSSIAARSIAWVPFGLVTAGPPETVPYSGT